MGGSSSENKQLEKHLVVTAILKKIKQVTVMVGVVENREASLKRGELNEGRSNQVRVGGEPSRQRGDWCKGPGVGMSRLFWRSPKEACVAPVQ